MVVQWPWEGYHWQCKSTFRVGSFFIKSPCAHNLRVMSYNVQEAVEDWVLSLSQNEVDDCLSQLEMKRQGTLFRNLDKLSKWVLGIYALHDFQVSARPDDVIARRMRLREDLLRRLVTEEDGTFVRTSKWDVHPLEVVLKSEQILEILHKTTAEIALSPATTQHPETTAEGDDNEDEDINNKQRNATKRHSSSNNETMKALRSISDQAMNGKSRQVTCYVSWQQMVRNSAFRGKSARY